jgi:hypothetical protein
MSGRHIGLGLVLAAILAGYLWLYVDWGRDGLLMTYELREPRRASAGGVYVVAFGFPMAYEFETIEVTVAPEGAVPASGGVGRANADDRDAAPAGDADPGEDREAPPPRDVADQASQVGLRMDLLERDEERIERMRQWAEDRDRSMPTFKRSSLVYGERVRGMSRENRPIRLEPGVVYRLEVRTVDGLRGEIDFATRALPGG